MFGYGADQQLLATTHTKIAKYCSTFNRNVWICDLAVCNITMQLLPINYTDTLIKVHAVIYFLCIDIAMLIAWLGWNTKLRFIISSS